MGKWVSGKYFIFIRSIFGRAPILANAEMGSGDGLSMNYY